MDFIAYDLETTGIDTRHHHIIEIGAVRFRAFKPAERFNQLVCPPIPIPEEAIAVHNISNEMVADAPTVERALPDFANFCDDLPLVAHNAKFDFGFLSQAIKRHKAKAPTGPTLDTKAIGRKLLPGLPSYRLTSLMHQFDIPHTELHRAEHDAEYCGNVFACMVQRLAATGQSAEIEDLLRISEMPDLRFPQVASSHEQLGLF